MSSLCGGACQRDLLEPIPKEKTMVEQTRLVHQLQQKEASLSQVRTPKGQIQTTAAASFCAFHLFSLQGFCFSNASLLH